VGEKIIIFNRPYFLTLNDLNMNSRRIFLKNAALTSGALMSSNLFASSSIFNTDTLRVATIGVNGMGWANTLGALSVKNIEVVALCDIDE